MSATTGGWDLIRSLAATAQAESSLASQHESDSSPPPTLANPSDMAILTSTPFSISADTRQVVRCDDCSKPILALAMPAHAVTCQLVRLKAQQAKAAAVVTSAGESQKRRRSSTSDSSNSPTKKPKQSLVVVLGDSSDKAKKKLSTTPKPDGSPSSSSEQQPPQKQLAKPANSKPRGPVDVDRQCGVINEKGFPCSRSLTCKTHSMGAKRSVPHRSQPYDILLHEWQKMNKPDFTNRKPVQPRVGPGSEAVEIGSSGKKKKTSMGSSGGGTLGAGGISGEGSNNSKREKREKAAAVAALHAGVAGINGGVNGGTVGVNGVGGSGGRGNQHQPLLFVGEWDESDLDPMDASNEWIDSDEEVEAVLKGFDKVGRGKPLTVIGAPLGGFSTASAWVGRNVRLGRLREALGGTFLSSAQQVFAGVVGNGGVAA